MQSDAGNPPDQQDKSPFDILKDVVTDPKAIQFLLLILVLDAVGLLPKITAYAGGVCG